MKLITFAHPYRTAGVVKIIDGITWKLLTGDPGCPLVDKQCPDTPLPNPFQSVRLFNLDIDPSEQLELSSQYPHIVSTLLRRIKHFDEYSVPYYYPDKETGCLLITGRQVKQNNYYRRRSSKAQWNMGTMENSSLPLANLNNKTQTAIYVLTILLEF